MLPVPELEIGDPYELLADEEPENDDSEEKNPDEDEAEYDDPADEEPMEDDPELEDPEENDPEHFLHQYTGLQTGTHFSLATDLH